MIYDSWSIPGTTVYLIRSMILSDDTGFYQTFPGFPPTGILVNREYNTYKVNCIYTRMLGSILLNVQIK